MSTCEVCYREISETAIHHLIPHTRRKKNKQDFRPDNGKSRPVYLCRPCHKRAHRLTTKEARYDF